MKNIKEYVADQKVYLSTQNKVLMRCAGDYLKLVIVQVGHVPASDRYVRNKIKDCEEIGIKCELYNLPEQISERDLCNVLFDLNNDTEVTGYIVQLPLPQHISEEKIKLLIDPKKDADGFHPMSQTTPATPLGIYNYLKDMNYEFTGKNAVILGRSEIVGKPMHQLLLKANMNVIMLHTKTKLNDKQYYLKNADLIVVATGHRNTLTCEDCLKQDAVVIDVGINVQEDGSLIGDCAKDLPVAFQTPVPGGVGLLTRLALIENLFKLYEIQKKEK